MKASDFFLFIFLTLLSFRGIADCDFRVVNKQGNRMIETSINVAAGETLIRPIPLVTSVRNLGQNDGQIYVRGRVPHPRFFTWKWHRVNSNEKYLGIVILGQLRCMETQNGERTAVDQGMDYLLNTLTSPTAVSPIYKQHQWHTLGREKECGTNLGNRDDQVSVSGSNRLVHRGARGNVNKFKNFVVTGNFNLMNHYLLIQASNKTYYMQIKHGYENSNNRWRVARNEEEFRCGAKELYSYWGFDDVMFANTLSGANAVIAEDEEKVIIAVRGTQLPLANPNNFDAKSFGGEIFKGTADVVINMNNLGLENANDYNLGAGRVHPGYAKAASDLSVLIISALQNMNARNKPLFITGHSLGAATATVLAQKLDIAGQRVTAAYVYAPPKVGNAQFNQTIRNTLPLYVTWNYRDPVPTLVSTNSVMPNPNAANFEYTFGAARRFIYFDDNHSARPFAVTDRNINRISRRVLQNQGEPYPDVFSLSSVIPISLEWHFHHGNFYTAFAYQQLLDSDPTVLQDTAIEPEFFKDEMCLYSDFPDRKVVIDWMVSINRFLRDSNGIPFLECGS